MHGVLPRNPWDSVAHQHLRNSGLAYCRHSIYISPLPDFHTQHSSWKVILSNLKGISFELTLSCKGQRFGKELGKYSLPNKRGSLAGIHQIPIRCKQEFAAKKVKVNFKKWCQTKRHRLACELTPGSWGSSGVGYTGDEGSQACIYRLYRDSDCRDIARVSSGIQPVLTRGRQYFHNFLLCLRRLVCQFSMNSGVDLPHLLCSLFSFLIFFIYFVLKKIFFTLPEDIFHCF